MQPLTKVFERGTGWDETRILRGDETIAVFVNETDADLFLQAEAMFNTADLSLKAGLELLKEHNELSAERDELRTVYMRACEELHAMKAALVDEGNEIPIGPAISLIEKLKADRDALAAHQANLVRELTACQSVLFQLARAGEVTPEHADEAKAVLECTPEISLGRHDARIAAEALEAAKTACALIGKGQNRLAWMHTTALDDGEKVIGEHGIPYSNKALGAQHCADEIDRMARKKRREAEGRQS